MADTLNKEPKSDRDVFYYRQRLKNRVFGKISQFFADEFERSGLTRKEIAHILQRDPAQITRWLSAPGNLTLDTISDLLLAAEAELETPRIVRVADKAPSNYTHALISRITGNSGRSQRGASSTPPISIQKSDKHTVTTETISNNDKDVYTVSI